MAAVTSAPPVSAIAAPRFTLFDAVLYAVTVFRVVDQLDRAQDAGWRCSPGSLRGVALHPGGGRYVRWVAVSKRPVRFPLKDHLRFMVMGALIFSINFFMFYLGGRYLASGLLSVVFSLASIFNLVLAAIVFRQRIEPRVAAGAAIGFAAHRARVLARDRRRLVQPRGGDRLLCCTLGTLFLLLGQHDVDHHPAPRAAGGLHQRLGHGLRRGDHGGGGLVNGRTFTVEWTLPYLGGLVWLSVVSSVIAFACYLTLLGRIGAARGLFDRDLPDLRPDDLDGLRRIRVDPARRAGLACVIAGNLIVLTRKR